jgi:hypothetical protein
MHDINLETAIEKSGQDFTGLILLGDATPNRSDWGSPGG